MHGMKNVGDTVARYLVFEFHGRPVEQAPTENMAHSKCHCRHRTPAAWNARRPPAIFGIGVLTGAPDGRTVEIPEKDPDASTSKSKQDHLIGGGRIEN